MQACGFSSRVAHIGPLNLSPGCSFLACQQLGVRQEKNVRIALATCHRRARPQSLAHTFCDPYTRCLLPRLASPRLASPRPCPPIACMRTRVGGWHARSRVYTLQCRVQSRQILARELGEHGDRPRGHVVRLEGRHIADRLDCIPVCVRSCRSLRRSGRGGHGDPSAHWVAKADGFAAERHGGYQSHERQRVLREYLGH